MNTYNTIRKMTDSELAEARLRNDEVLSWAKNNMVIASRKAANRMIVAEQTKRIGAA